ncbi:MAG: endonuclease MutS2 [Clostridiales bacterium]|nr:endonuclease MutS2 [Clostridiales bacterium]
MEFHEKSLNTLELPAVLEMLCAEAVSESAKERAVALRPSANIYEIADRLKETSDAKALIAINGNPSFYGVKDVSGALVRAQRGGMLSTRELLDIAGVLRAARTVKSYSAAEGTSLAGLFASLRGNKYLEETITNSITGEDEIADAASSELAAIRRHMRAASARVREALQKIISSPSYSKALQDPIITMRSDRYVVPVKAEHKNSVPGLVHDISASGATLFIEPMQAVKANNEIRELQAKEEKEIERILMALSAEAAAYRENIGSDFSILVELDLIFARAKLSYKLNCSEPEVSDKGGLVLRRARHPLLPQKSAVPIDIALGGDYDTLVITGPNTGGKTVSLKTLGLLCLMAQCGLHIPVDDGSRVCIFEKIMADIGDEQSIEQSLSTFSSHMTNIVQILEEAEENTLLLFDELGAGTDPVEGAALAIAIIEYARSRGAKIAATTHYAELKIYGTSTPGVMNASCEFDVETLRPTYRLVTGIPGKSNAFAISERLGLPRAIIADAESRLDSGSADFEKVLSELDERRQRMEKEQLEIKKLLLKAEEDEKKAAEYRKLIEREKEKAAKIARREADSILEEARRTADEVFDELSRIRRESAKENWQEVNTTGSEIMRKINKAQDSMRRTSEKEAPAPSSRPVKAGDTVEILSIGTKAVVESVSPDRVLTLKAGIMKITAREDEVRLLEGETIKSAKRIIAKSEAKLRTEAAKPEIDVRGMMSDEAVSAVEMFIDSAVLGRLETVRIIHGKGTGALRAAIQASLRKNRQVKSFRLGVYGEGESGVTIAQLK